MKHHWITLAVAAVLMTMTLVARAHASQVQKLRVVITSASGNSVYLDKGRADGIIEGLDVRFFSDSGEIIVGVVRAVSANSARVELPMGAEVPAIGTPGEVEVPTPAPPDDTEQPPAQDQPPKPALPEKPPWTRDISAIDPDAPLLAPVHRQDPKDRPYTFRARTYALIRNTIDSGEGRDNDFLTARLGASVNMFNLVGQGERIRLDTELDLHRRSYTSRDSESDTEWRIERFSYAVGGEDFSPYRFEAGRFYSIYLPELGLIDGAEGALQFQNGLSVGAGFGLLPENDRDRGWDDDIGAHIFLAYDSEEPGRASAVVGYQKTWHDGEADRDQIIARLNWRATDELWLFGSIRADIYTNDDVIKGSGVELTEFWTQLRYTPNTTWGAAISYSRFTFPEILREDFVSIPIQIIEDEAVDRVSVSGWTNLSETLRVFGNIGFWQDQENDGSNGDLGVDWLAFGRTGPTFGGAVFFTDGSFNSGEGFRIDARIPFGQARALVGYELFMYDLVTGFSGDDSTIRHLVRGGLSWNAGNWYFDVTGDYYFGDVDDMFTLGAYVSHRF